MIIHEIDPDLSGGAIAGIIIGVLAVLGLALVGFLFIIRQRRRRRSHGEPELNGRTEFAISDKPPATTENLKGMDGTALVNSGTAPVGGRLGEL